MSPWIGYSSNRSKIPYIKKRNQKLELRQEQWLKVKMNGTLKICRPMWYLAVSLKVDFIQFSGVIFQKLPTSCSFCTHVQNVQLNN